jgi:hypothetical protein
MHPRDMQREMPPAVCLMVKPVGKPDAVAPHVRFDERGWETGLHATAPILDSTMRWLIKLKLFT